jgi:hypothetical protein
LAASESLGQEPTALGAADEVSLPLTEAPSAEAATRPVRARHVLLKLEKRLGREIDAKDGNNAAVANAHATLALFHQREPEGESSGS